MKSGYGRVQSLEPRARRGLKRKYRSARRGRASAAWKQTITARLTELAKTGPVDPRAKCQRHTQAPSLFLDFAIRFRLGWSSN